MENMLELLTNANTQWVLLGALILGFASGLIGSFVLLKKQSLIGDAMAHATLPGVCMAYLIFGVKSIPLFLLGAACTGLLATYFIQAIVKHSRIKTDASIGVVLSVFFGLGIVLLTYISKNTTGDKSGLDDFIFGQAAAMVKGDIQVIAVGSLLIILISSLFFKELKISIFDPLFAKGIGLPVGLFNGILMGLVVGIVVVGIQMVGVVLIAALLITPPLAARYWTDQLGHMSFLSGIIGAISGVVGTLISTTGEGLPTGPLIVLCASAIFLISLLLGTRKGLITKVVKQA
ncbi:metal ABC transporter permease [Pontibacillus yanchengensis]|uniref:Manganese transport system membrane protein MntC n=1 Tax=Pontibacillus yanchengensis Y32 TaxID=1385514 RepID=A0A0A2TA08_9BACI|nr:iron chelate uptake ABC transporter family permease subunit [Pontibacillus yanchengensis]KGP71253.1 manganese ABC transporter permease [Pontibacillus yanchengensis Y32]